MPIVEVRIPFTDKTNPVRYAEAGDVITLDPEFEARVFLDRGLNASSFHEADCEKEHSEDLYKALAGKRFIVIRAGTTSPLVDNDPFRTADWPSLLLPLTDGNTPDGKGVLVKLNQESQYAVKDAGNIRVQRPHPGNRKHAGLFEPHPELLGAFANEDAVTTYLTKRLTAARERATKEADSTYESVAPYFEAVGEQLLGPSSTGMRKALAEYARTIGHGAVEAIRNGETNESVLRRATPIATAAL